MMRTLVLTLLGVLVLGACTDLPTFATDTCGNFVIDPGEDCDDDDNPDCQQCLLLCGAADPGEPCAVGGVEGSGYACGVDGYCHAPSGQFGAPGAGVSYSARELAITNVDGDSIGDVVTVSDTSIDVYFGAAEGSLETQSTILTPLVRGAPAFATLADGGSLDVLAPTADGVAAYSSPQDVDTIAPHSFAIDLKGSNCNPEVGVPFHVFAIDDRNLAVLTADLLTNKLGIAILPTDARSACPDRVLALCDVLVGDPRLTKPRVGVYPVRAPADFGVVIAARVGPAVGGGLCVVAVQDDGTGYQANAITPPGADTATLPVLADFDDTGCPGLVRSDAGPAALQSWAGLRSTEGACKLAGTPRLLANLVSSGAPPTARPIGHLPLSPRVVDVVNGFSYGKDALVLSSGVYKIPPANVTFDPLGLELYHADRELGFVLSGDLDRDGDVDGVAISTLPSPQDDLDVLRRSAGDGFLQYRIDSAAPITYVVVGDFDGDDVDDIAFTEKLSTTQERLLVSFGTTDVPAPPMVLGTHKQVIGLCPIQVDDSIDLFDTVQDLVVLDLREDMPTALTNPKVTLLHGSPQRTLQSFLDPRDSGTSSVFSGVVAGNFYGGAGVDVLGIELGATTKVWPLHGQAGGQLAASSALSTTMDSCAAAVEAGDPEPVFCVESARYTAFPMGAHDIVLGIDDGMRLATPATDVPRHVLITDPGSYASGMAATTTTTLDALTGAPTVPRELSVKSLLPIDLDGDGAHQLLVSFGALTDAGVNGELRLCTVTGGMLVACPRLADLVDLGDWTCVDAAAAHLAPRGRLDPGPEPGAELVVLCRGPEPETRHDVSTVLRVYRASGALRAEVVATLPPEPYVKVVFGDVTGDGLGDLVLVKLASPRSQLVVVPQCASSDLLCRDQLGVGAPMTGTK